jgi:hypothetical protein
MLLHLIGKPDEQPRIPPVAAKVAEQAHSASVLLGVAQIGRIYHAAVFAVPAQQSQKRLLKPDRIDFRP